MVKKLSITVSEKTYRDYIQDYKGNKSNFIEDNFLTGLEVNISELPLIKKQLNQLRKENMELVEELRKHKLIIANYKSKYDIKIKKGINEDKNLDRKRKENILRSLNNAGVE